MELSAKCALSAACLGVLRQTYYLNYYHQACDLLEYTDNCSGVSMDIYLKTSFVACGSGGTYNSSTGKCDCKTGWSGVSCDVAPSNCSVLLTLGYPVGSYWVDILSSVDGLIKSVYCELTSSSSYKLHVFRNTGLSDHNKTWAQFVQGYKIDTNNFWLGLDAIHSHTSTGGKNMKMEAVFQNNVVSASWGNSPVTVQSAANKYQISFYGTSSSASGSYSVSVQTCLNSGKTFSTWDTDNDGNASANLAYLAGAGWFFGTSLTCNPLGRLSTVLPAELKEGQILLPSLDMISGGYVPYFQYVSMYFY
ncbi:hypothetical protein Btru_054688 [Bulinus truncatus]|nr:hypothetical protein Btru_054688 [Bulinus truncatus]